MSTVDDSNPYSAPQSQSETAPQLPSTEPTPVAKKPQPVKPTERIQAIDVLRGVALLGILAMNIVFFAWPTAGYENPIWSGGDSSLNRAAWIANTFLFSGKMMSLFSMLFGAGLVLMSDRAAARGASNAGVYYRRVFWLLCIGLVHAYLIWSGDILVMYALCGFILFLFRRRSPRTLIILGVILLLIQSSLQYGFMAYGHFMASVAERVEANEAAGIESKEWEREAAKGWEEGMRAFMAPTQADVDKEIDHYQSDYLTVVVKRAPEVLMFQIFGFLLFALWGAGGRMLLGMALMKMGVFSAQRSWNYYRWMAMLGYGVGLPLTAYGVFALIQVDYSPLANPLASAVLSLGMVPVALGHAAIVMMIWKAGLVQALTDRLAAVGRMALTNYLMHSIICTFLFYGYGAGLFGKVERTWLWPIVISIWVLQLLISPIWLRHFRYGPAEWLWRSLTYWRIQPMKATKAA